MDLAQLKYEIISENRNAVITPSTYHNLTIDFEECPPEEILLYDSYFGLVLAVPEWEAILTTVLLSLIIFSTIVGNVLVILSVFTHKPLRIVQNFFIVSLAVADLTVATLVLPLNVAYSILGRWVFGIHLCKMWLTSDVMCCTSSILNLSAIALDRYWAITDPINYAQKRTLERVLIMIGGVWIISLIISSPPLFGWNDWPEEFSPDTPCQLTKQPGYVIYSSSGSFYIPLIIMTVVYIEIFVATRKRLRDRAKATKISTISSANIRCEERENEAIDHHDHDSISSEANHNDHQPGTKLSKSNEAHPKKKKRKIKNYWGRSDKGKNKLFVPMISGENSVTDVGDNVNNSHKNTSSESNSKENDFEEVLNDKSAKKALHPTTAAVASGTVYQFIEEKQKISLSRERRAARTLGIIMGVFVVCWLPFFLMYVILPFCPHCCLSGRVINFLTWLGYINSCLNPLIYTIFNMDFRRAFKKLLCLHN